MFRRIFQGYNAGCLASNPLFRTSACKSRNSSPAAEVIVSFSFERPSYNQQPLLKRENGAPGKSRTCDLLVRSQTLYPAELRALRYANAVQVDYDTLGETSTISIAFFHVASAFRAWSAAPTFCWRI